MEKTILKMLPVLLLFSCIKSNSFPRVETITKGSKWNITIGASPAEVYSQLQALGKQQLFNSVAIVSRTAYSKPADIKNLVSFYNSITLQSNTGNSDRVLIQLVDDKVSSIETGGGMLDSVSTWPQNVTDENAIKINDSTGELYQKLLGIYQVPEYSNYQIILPDKPLDKPYDADMANYNEWAFEFTQNINAETTGDNFVRLYFKNNKLIKIENNYSERQVVH